MSRNFLPEQELIDQLLLNDTNAFEELYHRYCFSLYSYCLDKLNSHTDAKKVVSAVFISLWENRKQLPVGFSLSAYLYTEVRKAVVSCINEKLVQQTDVATIEEAIIPGFTAEHLRKAWQPVHQRQAVPRPVSSPVIHTQKYKEQWWSHYPAAMNLKNLKYAFQKVMHLF
jgi:DNA-directed RNA polymerase specialized sigma24 family protein